MATHHLAGVPARVGGVDLSHTDDVADAISNVPARVGGVDLSTSKVNNAPPPYSPRPCGRGGFKHRRMGAEEHRKAVPARVGGVDLSQHGIDYGPIKIVPARVGGVDLSRFWSGL